MRKILLSLTLLVCYCVASAQFHETGVESGKTRWKQIDTKQFRLIYPEGFDQGALRFNAVLDSIYPWVNYNFKEPMRKIPIILRTKNNLSNGYVVWSPKRSELVTRNTLSDTYALSWEKQLTIHEARHIAQMSLMKTGLTKVAMWVMGEAGIGLGLSTIAKWQLEGDATLAETQFAEYGRGLQPEFTLGYRGFAMDGKLDFSRIDPWKAGSYKNYTPGIYEFGYQVTSAAETYLSPTANYEVFRYSAKYPILIVPEYFYLKHKYKTTYSDVARRAFAELDSIWRPTYSVDNSFETLTSRERFHTNYTNPIPWGDKIIATKWDMTRPSRFVIIDTATMKETVLHSTGHITSRPIISDNTLYWTEHKPHPLYAQENFSVIRSINLMTGSRKVHDRWGANYFITPGIERNTFAAVSIDTQSNSYIRIFNSDLSSETKTHHFSIPTTLHSLTSDPSVTGKLYFIALDQRGMWIGSLDSEGKTSEITAPSVVTIRDLTASDGKLYFSSIQSGKNEIHTIDLATSKQHRNTLSRLGSQNPSVAHDGSIVFSTYTPGGWAVARSKPAEIENVEWSRLPLNTLNPKRYKWNVPVLDSIQINPDTSGKPVSKRYHRFPRSFNVHSWAPVPFTGDLTMSENPIHLALGVTAFFQSALGEMSGFATYGWLNEMSWIKANATYLGLPVKIEFDAEYGGGYQGAYYPTGMTKNINASVTPQPYVGISTRLSVPLNLSRGANNRFLEPSLTLSHYNSLYYDEESETYGSDVQIYNASLFWSDTRAKGYRSILPRLGYALRLTTVGAFNSNFSQVYAFTGRAYLPSFLQTHTLSVATTFQHQPDDKIYKLSSKSLVPRGESNPYAAKDYAAAQLSYVMPLAYPDWGADGLLYIRRISSELFFDYSRGWYYSRTTKEPLMLDHSSRGAVISIENNILGSFSNTFSMTFANTTSHNFWFGIAISFDF